MSGAVPILAIYAFMMWKRAALPFFMKRLCCDYIAPNRRVLSGLKTDVKGSGVGGDFR